MLITALAALSLTTLVVAVWLWLRLRQQRRTLNQFRHLADSAHDFIWIIDVAGRFRYVSPSVEAMLGYRPEEIIGQPLDTVASRGSASASYEEIRHVLQTRELRFPRTELKYIRKDSSSLWVEVMVNLQRDERGRILGFYGIARDIDEQHKMRSQMYHLAHHDNLTDLPNRILFFDRMESALSRGRRHGMKVALLYLDLDDFKRVNDHAGHQEGDRVLQLIARRLQESLREEDSIARIGGDEFAAIIEHMQAETDLDSIIDKLEAAVTRPVVTDRHTHHVGVSIGRVIIDPDAERQRKPLSVDQWLATADHDMYRRKRERAPRPDAPAGSQDH